MIIYITAAILLLIFILIYFRVAKHFNIIDKPNERSSHSYHTIRGGGVIFPGAALLWFFLYGFIQPWILLGLVLMAVISFLDDVLTLSPKIRILVHLTAVSLLFWQTGVLGLNWYVVLLAFIFTIGWINAFNFMDGINGITPFYAASALAAFSWVNNRVHFFSSDLIILLGIALIIFSFFNARKRAKIFAGDVGSVSLAFLLAWMMIALMLETGRIEYILFFAFYGIDSVVTIVYRLIRRENIFEAHRSHLYQYLSNELEISHIKVAGVYALVQLAINILTIFLIKNNLMSWPVFIIFFSVLTVVYIVIRRWTVSKIQVSNC